MSMTISYSSLFRLHLCLIYIAVAPVSCQIKLSTCPEETPGVVKWSQSAWPNNELPKKNDRVVIDSPVKLDIQPPRLKSIYIKSGGYLILYEAVNLEVEWIKIEGEMHIGAENCRAKNNIKVTFTGDHATMDEFGYDKGLYVLANGVLEIHGREKLSWTKLTDTLYKPTTARKDAIVEQINTKDMPYEKQALIVYNLDSDTGLVIDEDYFVIKGTDSTSEKNARKCREFIEAIPDGNIVGLGVRRRIDRGYPLDLPELEDAVAMLAYGDSSAQTPFREAEYGYGYAMVTQKGNYTSTVEVYTEKAATAILVFGDLRVFVKSLVSGGNDNSFVKLVVSKGKETNMPKLNMLDDVTSWHNGDKIVIASTDYDWKQAEVREIISCSDCSSTQLRINDSVEYTHYGKMYKNVDMRAEVGLLSRNIVFDSEDASDAVGYGGHLKFLEGFRSVRIEDAEFRNLGAPQALGRYSIHFHMCRDVYGRQYIRRNSIHHAYTRCLTVHGSHNVTAIDNVCYLTNGHSYFLEDGGERDTVLEGNLGIGTDFGTLIPSDETRPATFWATNPNTVVRNNVAAGGEGDGFWFIYPEEPIQLSVGLGFMIFHEARYTPIREFYNNVAHSYVKFGLNIDQELHPDGTFGGYNNWFGKEDPVMHALYQNSTDKETIIDRFTGYKNRDADAWLRCGLLRMRQSSFSDSLVAVEFQKLSAKIDANFEKSVLIGNSPNAGEGMVHKGIVTDRSYPVAHRWDHPIIGFEVIKKPVISKKLWFDDFYGDREYAMSAIGFRSGNELRTSPQYTFYDVRFGFDDPSEGNRVIDVLEGEKDYKEVDGDENNSFFDPVGSITGIENVTVVRTHPFHITAACTYRPSWKISVCKHHYETLRIWYGTEASRLDSTNDVYMVRDDDPNNAFQQHDKYTGATFVVVLGGSFSYSMHFTEEWPDIRVKMTGYGVSSLGYVRAGICIPRGSAFEIERKYPIRLDSTSEWTEASSLEELDEDKDGIKYFYDSNVGYLAFIFRHKHVNDLREECPEGECVDIYVTLTSIPDSKDVNCLTRLHNKYGTNGVAPKNGPPVPNFEPKIYDTTLEKRSKNPPSKWGAGETRLPAKK